MRCIDNKFAITINWFAETATGNLLPNAGTGQTSHNILIAQ